MVWWRRARARAALLATIGLSALIVTLLLVTMAGLVAHAPVVAIPETLRSAPPQTSGVRAETTLADDATAQDAQVRRVVHDTFPGVDLRVARTVQVGPLPLEAADATRAGASSVALMFDDAVLRRAIAVVSGRWPAESNTGTGAAPAALQVDAAARLGVKPGDELTVPSANGDLQLHVVATWRAIDPGAPLWFGDPRARVGVSDGVVGPVIVGASTAGRVDATPIARWSVTPVASRIQADQVTTLATGFTRLESRLNRADVSTSRVSVTGEGARTARGLEQAIDVLRATIPLPIVLLLVAAVIAIALLARLLVDARAGESVVLRARGASTAVLTTAAAIETGALALPGAAVGALAAALIVWFVTGEAPPLLLVIVTAVAIIALTVGIVAGVTFSSLRRPLAEAARATRATAVAVSTLTVLVVLAAAFALWRLLAYGGAAHGQLDVAAIAAPALTVCAAVAIGVMVFGFLTPLADRIGRVELPIGIVTAARRVARDRALFTAPVALVVLAVVGGIFCAGYHGTWQAFGSTAARIDNGGDVRVAADGVTLVHGAHDGVDLGSYAGIAGVRGATAAVTGTATLGDDTVAVVATAPARLRAVLASDVDALGSPALTRTATTDNAEPELPAGTHALALRIETTTDDGPSTAHWGFTAWLVDDDGRAVPVGFAADEAASEAGDAAGASAGAVITTPTRSVPQATGRWHLAALDVTVAGATPAAGDRARLTGLVAHGRHGSTTVTTGRSDWSVVAAPFDTPRSMHVPGNGIGVTAPLDAARTTARLMPTRQPTPTPAFIGAALAARSGLTPGAKIALATQTWSADAIVRGAMSAVPTQSDGDAVLLDLGALVRDVLRTQQAPPATNEVWLRTDDTAGVAAWANRIDAGASVTRATNAVSDRFLNSAFVALALGCVGALALTGVALAATLLTLRRRRRGEVVHLRALGFTTRQQAAMRRVELGTVALAALIVGCVLGVLVFAVLAAPLARLSVLPQAPAIPVTLGVDPVWLCSVVGALLALIAVLVALAGRGISANRPRTGQEDDR